ncbi:MAG: TIGR00296 family protein [Acidilobaceae archaeon]
MSYPAPSSTRGGKVRVLDLDLVTIDLAKTLVKVARNAIEYYLSGGIRLYEIPRDVRDRFPEIELYAPVFVTLEKVTVKEGVRGRVLRGCIGFIEPVFPLGVAVIESAVSSAFNDPRFPPLRSRELKEVVLTLTILGGRVEVRRLDDVTIGRDALYVERGLHARLFSGILLPEVPVEYCWDIETFANMTCNKAGLELRCWEKHGTKLYRIPGRTFKELEPEGEIVEVDLVEEYRRTCKPSGKT